MPVPARLYLLNVFSYASATSAALMEGIVRGILRLNAMKLRCRVKSSSRNISGGGQAGGIAIFHAGESGEAKVRP